jgi:hypothetical protein
MLSKRQATGTSEELPPYFGRLLQTQDGNSSAPSGASPLCDNAKFPSPSQCLRRSEPLIHVNW